MSYQVGAACYATVVDAGVAACAQYAPVSTLVENGAVVRTVSCTSADAATGALNLQISSAAVDGSGATATTIQQAISFPACTQMDYVNALEVAFGGALALWVIVYSYQKISETLHWGRGDT